MSSQRHDASLHDELHAAAVIAAQEGASYIRSRTGDLGSLDWQVKSRADFVSEVDLGAERLITERLLDRFPDARVLGEELAPGTSATSDGVVFVVDPLDGTTNFLHGYPEYAVSIGVLLDGALTAGVVLEIPRDVTYSAIAGRGATRDGERMSVSSISEPIRALIGTGFPFKHPAQLEPYLPQFARISGQTSGLRRAGSAALDLAHVACGHFDAFWELMLAPWDIAAGMLLVREAGGRVSDLAGGEAKVSHTPLVASNGVLHEWMLGQLRG
ncbi:MAG: inositol monophosphatase family protein [Gemmatimonadota bacterium]